VTTTLPQRVTPTVLLRLLRFLGLCEVRSRR
jgi:hypothetical protein